MRIGLPVDFLVKLADSGFNAPLGAPKVAFYDCAEWAPPSRLNLPDKFEQTCLEVVLSPNVDAVGARSEGY